MNLKCPLSVEDQIKKLVAHGITIENVDEAKALLPKVYCALWMLAILQRI